MGAAVVLLLLLGVYGPEQEQVVLVSQKLTEAVLARSPMPVHVPPARGDDQFDDPCKAGLQRCVVAISLYGTNPFYLKGGLRNIVMARKYWPGWTVRVYTNGSMPQSFVEQLTTETSEVVDVFGVNNGLIAGMFWRFLVANDPAVDRYIIRDGDSSPSARETAALQEWYRSGRKFHVMRDNPYHGTPMLGGMWGGYNRGGKLAIPRKLMMDPIFSGKVDAFMQMKGGDQEFLKEHVWPSIDVEQELISHDAYLCELYPSTRPYPTRRKGNLDFVGVPMSRELPADWDVTSKAGTDERWMENNCSECNVCPPECRPPDHQDWVYC